MTYFSCLAVPAAFLLWAQQLYPPITRTAEIDAGALARFATIMKSTLPDFITASTRPA